MNLQLLNDKHEIKIEVKFLNKKNISIEITNKGDVIIRAPKKISKKEILELITKHDKWIKEKVNHIRNANKDIIERKFTTGEIIKYLGDEYSLITNKICSSSYIDELKKEIVIKGKNKDDIKLEIEKLYKKNGLKYIESRINFFEKYFDVKCKEIKVKTQKRKWGSCSFDNRLFFNWKILFAPKDVIDYLVIHEMSHMIHKNHSKQFWSEVESIIPDYTRRRKYLNENGLKFDL